MEHSDIGVPGIRIGRMLQDEALQVAGGRGQDDLPILFACYGLRRLTGFDRFLHPVVVEQRDAQIVALERNPGEQMAGDAQAGVCLLYTSRCV